jgi:hypothetical protein
MTAHPAEIAAQVIVALSHKKWIEAETLSDLITDVEVILHGTALIPPAGVAQLIIDELLSNPACDEVYAEDEDMLPVIIRIITRCRARAMVH